MTTTQRSEAKTQDVVLHLTCSLLNIQTSFFIWVPLFSLILTEVVILKMVYTVTLQSHKQLDCELSQQIKLCSRGDFIVSDEQSSLKLMKKCSSWSETSCYFFLNHGLACRLCFLI